MKADPQPWFNTYKMLNIGREFSTVTANPRSPALIKALAELRQTYTGQSDLLDQQQAVLARLLQPRHQRGGGPTRSPAISSATGGSNLRTPVSAVKSPVPGAEENTSRSPVKRSVTAWQLSDEEEENMGGKRASAAPTTPIVATTPVSRTSTEERLARLDAYSQNMAARFGTAGGQTLSTPPAPSPIFLGTASAFSFNFCEPCSVLSETFIELENVTDASFLGGSKCVSTPYRAPRPLPRSLADVRESVPKDSSRQSTVDTKGPSRRSTADRQGSSRRSTADPQGPSHRSTADPENRGHRSTAYPQDRGHRSTAFPQDRGHRSTAYPQDRGHKSTADPQDCLSSHESFGGTEESQELEDMVLEEMDRLNV